MLCKKHFNYGRVKQPEKHLVTNSSARVLGIVPVKHFIVCSGTVFKPVVFPVTGSFGILLIRLLSQGTIQLSPLTPTPLLMMVYFFNRFYLLLMLISVILQLVFKKACCRSDANRTPWHGLYCHI
jgi:hypothetical protein